MSEKLSELPIAIYNRYLRTIRGISFTQREIEIMGYILNGRSSKKISILLNISPRTVDTHIRNITLKIEGHSREDIIDFIEQSKEYLYIKDYNYSARVHKEFENILTQISLLRPKTTCALIYWKNSTEKDDLIIQQIINHLHYAGISTKLTIQNAEGNLRDAFHKTVSYSEDFTLFAVSNNLRISDVVSSWVDNEQDPSRVYLLFLGGDIDRGSLSINNEIKKKIFFFQKNFEYYFSFLGLLKKLYPEIEIESFIDELKELYEKGPVYPISQQERPHLPILHVNKKQLAHAKNIINFFKHNIRFFGFAFIGVSLAFCISVFFLMSRDNFKVAKSNNTYVYSNVVLPGNANLLLRPHLIAKIDEKFKKGDNIQTIALVGPGGAGKTTLARQYASQKKESIVWEINAETKETQRSAFEYLAETLSKTEADKKTLSNLKKIENPNEREEKIISFVRERLKSNPNWFLIYDNVESFNEIHKHFPNDVALWGKGKILITTQDNHIQNHNQVTDTIQIGELDKTERLKLFTSIMAKEGNEVFIPDQKENTLNFLEKIPPFPLDVSIAAFYMKATSISFKKYLEHLANNNAEFTRIQQNLLNETGNYSKTRYLIITLAAKELIDSHKEFQDLLLLVSLLDSQNIPRYLLDAYKNDLVVDHFIYFLKKYSLITNETSHPDLGSTISIHRSTQDISLAYLTRAKNLENNKQALQAIVKTFENYTTDLINKDNLKKIKFLITHCKSLLNHKNLLTDNMLASINCVLGCIYYCLSYYEKAQHTLEEALMNLDSSSIQNYPLRAKILVYLGIVTKTVGDRKYAKNLFETGLDIITNHIPNDHASLAWALLNLGDVYRNLGEYQKAKSALEKSLIIYKKNKHKNYIGIARALLYLGTVYRDLGNYELAKNILEQSLDLYKKHVHSDHLRIARILVHIGNLDNELGDYKNAKQLIEQSLAIYKKYLSGDHIDVGWTLTYLGRAYTSLGDHEKAKALLEKSAIIHKNFYPESHIEVAWAFLFLGNTYKDLGQYEKAKTVLEKSLNSYEEHYGKDHTKTARILMILGQVYSLEGNLEAAKNTLDRALSIYQKNNHSDQYKVLESLAELYLNKSTSLKGKGEILQSEINIKQAVNYLKKALDITKANFPKNSFHSTRIYTKLKKLEGR